MYPFIVISFNTASGKRVHATLDELFSDWNKGAVSIPQAVRGCMQLNAGTDRTLRHGFNTASGKRVHATNMKKKIYYNIRFNTASGKRVHATKSW